MEPAGDHLVPSTYYMLDDNEKSSSPKSASSKLKDQVDVEQQLEALRQKKKAIISASKEETASELQTIRQGK